MSRRRNDQPSLFDEAPPPDRRPVDADTAPVGRNHPDTAVDAAARALPRTGTRRREVFDLIAARGGMTAEEVGKVLGLPHQSYSAAVSTLARDGWLVDSGRRHLTDAGNPAIIYRAAPLDAGGNDPPSPPDDPAGFRDGL